MTQSASWAERAFTPPIILDDGTVMPLRSRLNFIGCTVTDNEPNDSTDVEPAGGGGGITALTGDVTASGTGSVVASIAAGAIVNADVNASAAIAVTKLATGAADGEALVRVSGANAFAKIADANISSTAAIALSKLAPGTNAQIPITNSGGTAWVGVSISGDATVDAVGLIKVTRLTADGGGHADIYKADRTTKAILIDTAHGHMVAGLDGTDATTTIGPLTGSETSLSALWLLGPGVARTSGNWCMAGAAGLSNLIYFGAPTAFVFLIGGVQTMAIGSGIITLSNGVTLNFYNGSSLGDLGTGHTYGTNSDGDVFQLT